MKYYVYVAYIGDVVAYVGKGQGNRYKHISSGTSHVYNANKAHFEGIQITTEIIERFECEISALAREADMIETLKPLWNNEINPTKLTKGRIDKKGKGVQFKKYKTKNPWYAYYHFNNKKIHIGYYATEDEAIKARLAFS